MQLDIEQTVLAARRPDAEAFGLLAHHFYPVVHALGVSIVNDWDTAGDVAQETLLLAWANLGQLKHPRAFPVWLRRIARNVGYTCLRSTEYRTRLAQAIRSEKETVAHAPPGPAETAARRECLERIGDALMTLSPRVREALILYYLEGRSVSESAETLGITTDAMKKRLQTGCEHLREYYARRRSNELEPLLPYSPQQPVERVLAGMAVGPAVPSLGHALGTSPFTLGLHHLWHGGAWSELLKADLAKPLAMLLVASVAAVIPVTLFTVACVVESPPRAFSLLRNLAGGKSEAPWGELRVGLFTLENWDSPDPTKRVLILSTTPDSSAERAGLRIGDSILKVNGQPIKPGYARDPLIRRPGPDGPMTCFTISRPSADLSRREFDVNLVWHEQRRK